MLLLSILFITIERKEKKSGRSGGGGEFPANYSKRK
jgi:hypothetical protein